MCKIESSRITEIATQNIARNETKVKMVDSSVQVNTLNIMEDSVQEFFNLFKPTKSNCSISEGIFINE